MRTLLALAMLATLGATGAEATHNIEALELVVHGPALKTFLARTSTPR